MKNKWKIFRLVRIAAAALVFAVMLAAFSGLAAYAAKAPQLEFAPALLRCRAAFSLGALAVVAVISLLTWLFGRFYCAALCPLGIWQDLAGAAARRPGRTEKNHPVVRYFVAGIAFGGLAAGWTLPFMFLDPYSVFGRGVSGKCALWGLIVLAVVTLLAVWKKRLFCTAICPVGTLLGLFGRFGLFKLRLSDRCVKCGQCVKACPAGCIDPKAGTLDNERCVRCLNCLSVCRVNGVEFSIRRQKRPEGEPVNVSRRRFLVNGMGLCAGVTAGAMAAKYTAVSVLLTDIGRASEKRNLILPPGAGDLTRFTLKCTSCQLCTANCPAKIIVPAPRGAGPVRLDLARGACRYDCDKCSSVCPTGAILPLGLTKKQRTKIAEAKFDARRCLACHGDAPCGKCADACPAGAIKAKGPRRVPRLNKSLCIGCGACQAVCPAIPVKAMTVHGVWAQNVIKTDVSHTT